VKGDLHPWFLLFLNLTDGGKIIITDIKERSYTLYTITDGTDPDNCLLPPALNNEIFDIRFSTGKFAEDVSTGIHPIELKGIPGLSFRMKQVIY
jgi:hypothetical protein